MKNYIIVLISTLFLASCSDWLDVNPKSEVKEEEMFSTEDGFKDALTGIYIRIASQSLYGEKTTMYFPELLAQHWYTTSFSTATKEVTKYLITTFDFKSENVESIIDTMWTNYYKSIAEINELLTQIEGKESLFSFNNYNLIKGEALGLRGFLHFEILRLWGPVPSVSNSGEKYIPYVKELTKDPNKTISISYSEILDNIITDLDSAQTLLAKDPITKYANYQLNSSFYGVLQDNYQLYRQNKFNYYAVLATKARYYLWINNKNEALKYANLVIEAIPEENSDNTFTLGNQSSLAMDNNGIQNLTMPTEHIFSIHNPKLENVVYPEFIQPYGLYQTTSRIENAYEKSINPDDIRIDTRFWEEKQLTNVASEKQNFFKKYWKTETTSIDVVPVIRLSEMYFIAIECSSLTEAKRLFEIFRVERKLSSITTDELIDESSVISRLTREYRKEFYAEGQMFFFYKRNNLENLTWPAAFTITPEMYKIPKPQSQTNFE